MPTGTLTTYDLTVGVMLDMEDIIHLLDPFDVPLLGTYGADGRTTLAKGTTFEKKVEWLDEELLTPRSTLAGSIASTSASITVASGHGLRFQVGDILRIGSEHLRVTGTDYASDLLAVTRSYGTAAAASAADGALVVGVGTALAEGSDPEEARALDRTARYNVTQIFGPYQVKVSGTENVVRKYGLKGTTEFQHQVANRLKEISIAQEQAILYGERVEDTSNNWRSMGGLDYWFTTNVDSVAASITEARLIALAQACFDAGGNPDRLVVGANVKSDISGFQSDKIRYVRGETRRGQVVEYFVSDFGQLSLHLDRWVRSTDGFMFNRDQVEVDTLRPMVFEPLAKTGDSIKGQLVCEKTIKVRRERHGGKFSALT